MKKIMFNEPFGLQQATFDGSKDMTRRVIPQCILDAVPQYQEEYYAGALEHIEIDQAILNMVGPEKMFQQYVYQVGEVVAIAQRYSELWSPADLRHTDLVPTSGWDNKMYVKAELMPRHIRILALKVEGLACISDEDCLKEGIYVRIDVITSQMEDVIRYQYHGSPRLFKTPYEAYKDLIDRMNKRGFFETNPLVYAYTFEYAD